MGRFLVSILRVAGQQADYCFIDDFPAFCSYFTLADVNISIYVVLDSKGTLYSMTAWAYDSDGDSYKVPILLPALSGGKSAAYKAVCISNQRQIGIARQLYTNDNAGFLILFDCPAEKRIPRLAALGKVSPGSWGYQQNTIGIHNNLGNRLRTEDAPTEEFLGLLISALFGSLLWFRLRA